MFDVAGRLFERPLTALEATVASALAQHLAAGIEPFNSLWRFEARPARRLLVPSEERRINAAEMIVEILEFGELPTAQAVCQRRVQFHGKDRRAGAKQIEIEALDIEGLGLVGELDFDGMNVSAAEQMERRVGLDTFLLLAEQKALHEFVEIDSLGIGVVLPAF